MWLGIDLGNARVGLALSDPELSFAYPAGNIRVYGDYFQSFDDVLNIIEEKQIDTVVVGLPIDLHGREGHSASRAKQWAHQLRKYLEEEVLDSRSAIQTVPDIVMVDERLTTVDAHRKLYDAHKTSRKHRAVVDQQAAVEILQMALDRARRDRDEV